MSPPFRSGSHYPHRTYQLARHVLHFITLARNNCVKSLEVWLARGIPRREKIVFPRLDFIDSKQRFEGDMWRRCYAEEYRIAGDVRCWFGKLRIHYFSARPLLRYDVPQRLRVFFSQDFDIFEMDQKYF